MPLERAGEGFAGVDEAGRGPLAGPVYAAAVILDPRRPIHGLADSKVLTEKARQRLAPLIREQALAYCVASASVQEIDDLNILHASMLAMRRAVLGLTRNPPEVWVDGNRAPNVPYPVRTIVQGDAKIDVIAAASILAKTCRDSVLRELDLTYPEYGFARHKGYPTADHLEILARIGPCPAHRRSFAPVRRAIDPECG